MMEKKQLRSADCISAIMLIAFGLWVLITTVTTFPMKGSWGGVKNVWYVSPALFPIFISVGIIGLGIVLLLNAMKEGALATLSEKMANFKPGISEDMLRFFSIVLVFAALVYVYVPRNDFFLAALFCLTVFMSTFYLDQLDLLKTCTGFFFVASLVFFLLAVFNISPALQQGYVLDILLFLTYLGYIGFVFGHLKDRPALRKSFSLTLLISFAVPLFLVPLFKYALLVPFPTEGGAIEIMNMFWYSPTIKVVRKVTGPYLLLLGIFAVFVAIIAAIYFKFLRETDAQRAS